MKKFKLICSTLLLLIAFSMPVLAGELQTPCRAATEQGTADLKAPGELSTPGRSVVGTIDSPPSIKILLRRTLSMAVLLAASAPAASQEGSVNVTGAWTGTFTFKNTGAEQRSAYLPLDQKDSEITGTAGPNADSQMPIAKGRIATVSGVTTVTFEVGQPDGPPLKFELEVVNGRLKGKAIAEAHGEKREATVDVGRDKS